MKTASSSLIRNRFRGAVIAVSLGFALILVISSWRDPDFWSTPDQRGDALSRRGEFKQAAKTYEDPIRIGTAQYRNGDFKEAAQSFGRVPGAIGAFDQGNALLMHGAYDQAIASYDRALVFHPGWKEAVENRNLAIARRDKIEKASQGAAEAPDDKADAITFDQKGENKNAQPVDLAQGGDSSDEDFRAIWLRRVQTTPGDFLRAKFSYQAQVVETPPTPKEGK